MTAELDRIMIKLNTGPLGNRQSYAWLKELILDAVYCPDRWQEDSLTKIGKRESITRERVRQILCKAVCDNWSNQSKSILEEHFGYPLQARFKYVKPDPVEFITLISNELRKKYNIIVPEN